MTEQMELIQEYQQMLEAVPSNTKAFEALKDIYNESQSWQDLASLYTLRAENVEEETNLLSLQAAALYFHKLQDPAKAIHAIQKVLKEDAKNAQALALWRQISIQQKEYSTAIKILKQETDISTDNVKKSSLFLEIGKLFEDFLHKDKNAAVAFHQAFLLSPQNVSAMEKAFELYKKLGEWERAIAVLRSRMETVQEPQEKALRLTQMGQILLRHTEQAQTEQGRDKVAKLFQQALTLAPQLKEAQNALSELEFEKEDWSSLFRRLKKELKEADSDDRMAFLNYKIAEGYYKKEERPAFAIRYCKQAIELDPHNQEAQELLQTLYAEMKRWPALAEFYQEQVELSKADKNKIVWLKKLAKLFLEVTKENDRALDAYEQILAIAPEDIEVLEKLEVAYRQEKSFQKALQVMEKRVHVEESFQEQREILLEMASLSVNELKDPDKAISYYEEVLDRSSQDQEVMSLLAPLYEVKSQWSALIHLYQKQVELSEDTTLQGNLLEKIGDIHNTELGLSKEAFANYQNALSRVPQNRELIHKIEALARQLGDWDAIIELYETTLHATESKEGKAALYVRIGEIYEQEVRDMEKAQLSLESALQESFSIESSEILERIYRGQSLWEELSQLLKSKVKFFSEDTDKKIEVLEELSQIFLNQLQDQERAISTLNEIIALEPTHSATLHVLEKLYKQSENWEGMKNVYQCKLGIAEKESEQIQIRHQLAQLVLEKLGQAEEAILIYQQIKMLAPQDNRVLAKLEELYRKLEKWPLWVEISLEHVENIRNLEQKKNLLHEIAKISEEKLHDSEQAIAAYFKVLEADAQDTKSLDHLLRLFIEKSDEKGQLEVLQKKVAISNDVSEKVQWTFDCIVLHEKSGNEGEQISALEQIIGWDPKNIQAIRSLQDIWNQKENNQAVLPLMILERNLLEGDDKKQISIEIAQILISLEKYTEAIDELGLILKQDPTNHVAKLFLEQTAKDKPEYQMNVFSILEDVYRKNENWELLAQTLEVKFEKNRNKKQRLVLATEIKTIYLERLENTEKSFHWLTQLVQEDFSNTTTREQAEQLAAELNLWSELLGVYEKAVRSIVEPREIIETYLFLAEKNLHEMNNQEKAVGHFRHVLDYDPQNEEAISNLETIFREKASWRELIDILYLRVQQAAIESQPTESEEQQSLLLEIAAIWDEKIEEPTEAIQVLLQLHEKNQDDLDILHSLGLLYKKKGQLSELSNVWEKELALLEGQTEYFELAKDLGLLYFNELQKKEEALDLFQKYLEHDSSSVQVIAVVETLLEDPALSLASARLLETIYLEQENYEQLQVVYSIQLENGTQSITERRNALMRLGSLHEDKLALLRATEEERRSEYREAFEKYLHVYRENPNQEGCQEALVRMAKQTNLWSELAKAFQSGVSQLSDVPKKVGLHLLLATIFSEHLQKPEQSIQHHQTIVNDLEPNNLQALEALEKYYSAKEQWNPLVEVLFQKADAVASESERKELFFQIAQIYDESLKKTSDAIDVLNQYLSSLQQDRTVVSEVEVSFQQAQQLLQEARNATESLVASEEKAQNELKELQQQWIELEEKLEKEESGELLSLQDSLQDQLSAKQNECEEWTAKLEAAEVKETDAADAFVVPKEAYDRFLEESSASPEKKQTFQLETYQLLGDLYEKSQRWEELIEVLNKEVDILGVDADESFQKQFIIAQVLDHELEKTTQAIGSYRNILKVRPNFSPALSRLEELAEKEEYQLLVAQSLDSYFREEGADWTKLIEMIEIQLQFSETQQEKIDFLKEIVNLYENELDNPSMSFVYLSKAFKECPTDEDLMNDMERLAEENDAWEELVLVYEDQVEKIKNPPLELRMFIKIASIYDEALQSPQDSMGAYEKAFQLDPKNSDVLASLDRLYRQQRMWEKLLPILEAQAAQAEGTQEKIRFLLRIAEVWEKEISNERTEAIEEAIFAYNQVLQQEEYHKVALASLEGLYHQQENWEELYNVCSKRAEIVEDSDEKALLRRKLAQLSAGPLGRADEAIAQYEKVLETQPEDVDSLMALEQLYSSIENWEQQAETIALLLELLEAPQQRKHYLFNLGQLHSEKLTNQDEAVLAWESLLEIDPTDTHALRQLQSLYSSKNDFENLCDILQRLMPLQSSQEESIQLQIELASVYQEKLDCIEDAIVIWKRIVDTHPEEISYLSHLESLLRETEDWRGVLDILSKKEQQSESISEKTALLSQSAEICMYKLALQHRAAPFYEKILTIEPDRMDVIQELLEIYQKAQDWNQLIETFNKEIPFLEDPSLKTERYKQIAEIYEHRLFNSTLAFESFFYAFQFDPSDENVISEMERLSAEIGAWDTFVEVLALELGRIEDEGLRVRLLLRIGSIYQQELLQEDQAVMAFREAFALEPTNLVALNALEELFEANQSWKDLIEIYRSKVEISDSLEDKKEILYRMGDLFEHEINDNLSAIEVYLSVLELSSEEKDALLLLEKLYRSEERWSDLAGVLEVRSSQEKSDSILLQLQIELGRLYVDFLDRQEDATQVYKEIIRIAPDNLEALRGLANLYNKQRNWSDLLALFEKEEKLVKTDEEKINILYRMSVVYEQHLEQNQQAVACFNRVLELDSWNVPAIEGLERLYEAEEQWVELIETYENHIQSVTDYQSMADLYYKIGSVYEQRLEQPQKATTFYQRVLDVEPLYPQAVLALSVLFEASKNWAKCIEMKERLIQIGAESEKLVVLYAEIGTLFEERLGQTDRAKENYHRALEIHPGYVPALRALRAIYYFQKDWNRFIALTIQEEQFAQDVREKAELHREVGKVYKDKLLNIEQAIHSFAQSVECDPSYLEAAKTLVELYFEQEAWSHAQAVLEHLIVVLQEEELSDELYLYHYYLAHSAEKQEKVELSLHHYQESYNLNTEYYPTLKGLGQIYFMQEKWEQSRKVYQLILSHHQEELNEKELSEVFFCLGRAFDQMGGAKQAVEYYEQALQIDPTNPFAIRRLADYAAADKNWLKVYDLKDRLLLLSLDEQESFQLNMDLAEISHLKLNNPLQAAQNYRQALRFEPSNTKILYTLLEIYEQSRQWNEMIGCLARLAELQKDPIQKRNHFIQMAEVYSSYLQNLEQACVAYNQAFDLDPELQSISNAFVSLETLLSNNQRWDLLEQTYIQMLGRLSEGYQGELKITLWERLGELYLTQLQNLEQAIISYEWVYNLQPESQRLRFLAGLYSQSPENKDKAVAAYQKLLHGNPGDYDSYKALLRLYYDLNKVDKAFCVASALKFLGQTDANEEEFYNTMKSKAPERLKSEMQEELWTSFLLHPSVKNELASILDLLYRACGKTFSQSPKEFGVKKNSQVEPQSLFFQVFDFVAKTMKLTGREAFKASNTLGVSLVNTSPPIFLVGEDMFKNKHPKELYAMISRCLVASRPEFIFATIFGANEFLGIVSTFLNMFDPNYPLNCPAATADVIRKKIQKSLNQPLMNQFQNLVTSYLQNPNRVSPEAYLAGVEMTMNRLGLCISNDLQTSTGISERDGRKDIVLSNQDRMKDLVLFSVSEEYFSFREKVLLALRNS